MSTTPALRAALLTASPSTSAAIKGVLPVARDTAGVVRPRSAYISPGSRGWHEEPMRPGPSAIAATRRLWATPAPAESASLSSANARGSAFRFAPAP